jgi:hypothetical protein
MKEWLGWRLMSIPWLTTASLKRGMQKRNWHARLYFLGARLANPKGDQS